MSLLLVYDNRLRKVVILLTSGTCTLGSQFFSSFVGFSAFFLNLVSSLASLSFYDLGDVIFSRLTGHDKVAVAILFFEIRFDGGFNFSSLSCG